MKRKVIKQGHNTLTITLPSKWAVDHGVKPGDELEIGESDRSLIINPNGNGAIPSSTSIDISGLSAPLIWRYISSAYRAGYDEIAVSGIGSGKKSVYSAFSYNTLEYLRDGSHSYVPTLDLSPMETVSAVVNRLVGVEIVDQRPNYCLIKDMSEVTDKEFGNALRRIFALVQTEMDSIDEAFNGKDDGLKSIHIVDTNIDRFEDFCIRVLNKKGHSSIRKTSAMHSLVFILELVGDEFKKIAMHMLEDKGRYSPAIVEVFRAQKQQVETFHKLFYKFDKALSVEIFRADSELTKKANKLSKRFNEDEKELFHHLKKVGTGILSLTELKVDMEF